MREIRELLGPYGIEPVSAAELDLPEPDEIGTTFIDNADLKARAAADLSGLPALADDSGLCVEALGDRPGIFSARWALADPRVPPEPARARSRATRDFGRAMRRVEDGARGARPRGQPQRPFRLRARGLLARRPQRMVRGPGRRHPGLAAARRRTASATTRSSSPPATTGPSARWTRPRSTRSATAPTPSASWWRRCSDGPDPVRPVDMNVRLSVSNPLLLDRQERPSTSSGERCGMTRSPSTSTGRSASPNAPIATSTAMSARPSTRRRGARRCSPTSPMRRADVPGRRLTSIFFGGGTPSLMPPATVAALIEAAERPLGLRARHRDHARGQSLVGRGGALRRSRRAPGSTASRSACSRSTTRRCASSAAPMTSAEGLAALGDRAGRVRAGQLRPDLRPARPERRRPGRPSSSRALGLRHRPSLALPAHHRARHALRRAGGAGRARPRRSRTTAPRSTS